MDRTLAAIHHDYAVELAPGLVEDDLVVADERVATDHVRLQVRADVVPVDARSADRQADASERNGGIHPAAQRRHVPVHAVVVIEEAVADPEKRSGLAAQVDALGPRLRAGVDASKAQERKQRSLDESNHRTSSS